MPKDEAQLYAANELYALSLQSKFYISFSIASGLPFMDFAGGIASFSCRYNRGWFYHREHRLWFMRVTNMEPLVKTNTYERGSYICFDPNTWETVRKV